MTGPEREQSRLAPPAEYTQASTSAPEARRALEEWLHAHGWAAEQRFDALLALSEIATNAVQHAGGRFVVRARLVGDEVAIEVWDAAAALPRLRPPGPDGGIGLRLVNRVARDLSWWHAEGGKIVSFRVPRAPASA